MGKKSSRQPGPQDHAEGQHGPKTRARLQEILHSRPAEPPEDHEPNHDDPSRHRLFSDRRQNDPADEKSDKNRLAREVSRNDYDREDFQIQGGAAAHTAMPPNEGAESSS